jgi:hypothetical protein
MQQRASIAPRQYKGIATVANCFHYDTGVDGAATPAAGVGGAFAFYKRCG